MAPESIRVHIPNELLGFKNLKFIRSRKMNIVFLFLKDNIGSSW